MRGAVEIRAALEHLDRVEPKESAPDDLSYGPVGAAKVRQGSPNLKGPGVAPPVSPQAEHLVVSCSGSRESVSAQVDQYAVRTEQAAGDDQGMNHALAGHSSQRPREHRDVEAATGDARAFGGPRPVTDLFSEPRRGEPDGSSEDRRVGVDRVHEPGHAGHLPRQPSLTAADIDDAGTSERGTSQQGRDHRPLGIAPVTLHAATPQAGVKPSKR